MADPIFGQGLNPEPVIHIPAAGSTQFDNRGKVLVPKPVHIVNLPGTASKPQIAALTPIAADATLAQAVTAINAIIAALKA